jgi:hypothetical protein
MKIIFLLILLFPLIAISQSKPYYKQITTAYEINKKDTINKKIFVTYLDSLRKVITTENNISNAISGSKSKSDKTHSIIEVDTDRLYISADINEKGDTIGKLIYVYDEKKNRTENYQIRNGDTINGQKRIYNESGKYTKLYNKHKENHKYFLSMEWEYDSNGNTTQCKTYSEIGKLAGFDKYENVYKKNEFITTKSSYVNDKGFVKKMKEIKKDNVTTTYFYSNSVGYNYGVKISNVDGGMRIQEDDEKGNMKELKIFDDNKNLIVYIMNSEIKLQSENK